MNILVDIGNSRVKWAVIQAGRIGESQHFARTKSGIKASLNAEWKTLEDVEAIFVSNVAGEKIATQLTEWTQKQWGITPSFIQSEAKKFGVTNAYQEPEKLGVDRWLALIAARQHARTATCVIDCGTAITIDVVTKYGLHQGGMILPGLSLMRESLIANTGEISGEIEESDFITLATNTHTAIHSGSLYAISATLERLIDDLKEQYNNRIRFIITGGDAEFIRQVLTANIAHYPDIVLKGLGYYARQSGKEQKQINAEAVEAVEAVEATSLSETAN